jgi:hypothetical protein
MRTTVASVVSWVVLIAVVGWAGWPYLESAGSSAGSKIRVAEVAVAQLAGATGLVPARDPFQAFGEVAAGQSTPAPLTTASPAAEVPGSELAAGALDRPGRPSDPAQDPTDSSRRGEAEIRANLTGQVALSATSIRGERRMAVLNGRTYAEGETIKGITGPGPVILAAVRPMSVRLRSGGTTVDVAFSRASAATRPPPAVATPSPSPARPRPTRGRARR